MPLIDLRAPPQVKRSCCSRQLSLDTELDRSCERGVVRSSSSAGTRLRNWWLWTLWLRVRYMRIYRAVRMSEDKTLIFGVPAPHINIFIVHLQGL